MLVTIVTRRARDDPELRVALGTRVFVLLCFVSPGVPFDFSFLFVMDACSDPPFCLLPPPPFAMTCPFVAQSAPPSPLSLLVRIVCVHTLSSSSPSSLLFDPFVPLLTLSLPFPHPFALTLRSSTRSRFVITWSLNPALRNLVHPSLVLLRHILWSRSGIDSSYDITHQ